MSEVLLRLTPLMYMELALRANDAGVDVTDYIKVILYQHLQRERRP